MTVPCKVLYFFANSLLPFPVATLDSSFTAAALLRSSSFISSGLANFHRHTPPLPPFSKSCDSKGLIGWGLQKLSFQRTCNGLRLPTDSRSAHTEAVLPFNSVRKSNRLYRLRTVSVTTGVGVERWKLGDENSETKGRFLNF